MDEKKTNPLWNILKSVKLTLILLSLLAVVSIIGTLIQQQDGAGIYHSLWFRLIILCLAINLIVCSIDRFPVTFKRFRLTPSPDRSKIFDDAPPRTILLSSVGVKQISSSVKDYLKGSFNNLAVKENDSASFIYCEKGQFSLFSVYLVHLSILFILVGAMIGSIFGFDGYINIPEGMATDRIIISDGDGYRYKELGFSVRCDKFMIGYYDNGTPKEYRSDLTFFAHGEEALKGSLLVNHPITFMGITFYQSSYGTVPGEKVRIKVINNGKGAEETIIEAGLGKAVMLPDNKGELTLSDIRDNFMNMMGPAAFVTIKSPEGQETPIILFPDEEMIKSRFPEMFEMSPRFDSSAYSPFLFQLEEIDSVPYTGLQVTSDPGAKIVFIGFIIIVIGLFLTFFTSHRRLWIRIEREKGDVKVSIAGTANKNPVGMERELDRLYLKLKKFTEEGKHND